MCGMRFDPAEVDLERRVIGEERARELNSPQGRLDQNHLALAYLRHPYRNPILGWPDDIGRIGVEDLIQYYREHYRPNEAVLVVVGDVDPDRALDRIAVAFERNPAGDVPASRPTIVEPRQSGRRDFMMAETDGVARGLFGWRTVSRGHADVPGLLRSWPICSASGDGRGSGSRWSRKIGPATWVEASHAAAQPPGNSSSSLRRTPVSTRPTSESVHDELVRLADPGPSPEELARSQQRLEAAWRWEREDLAAAWFGQRGALG